MRRAYVLLVVSTACTSGLGDYRVAGDRVFVERGGEIFECRAGGDGAVAIAEYAEPTTCIDRDIEVRDQWHAAKDRIVFRSDADDGDVPECAGRCSDLTVIDLTTAEETTLLTRHRSVFGARTNGRWVVWADLRHDRNGFCFFPRGDTDCNIDIYGYDLESETEHRLTTESTVGAESPTDELWVLAIDDERVVFVDRRGLDDPSCFGADGIEPVARCPTQLYEVDLATRTERALVTSAGSNRSPTLQGSTLGWIRADGEHLSVFARLLDADATERLVTDVIDDARYALVRDHVVTTSGGRIIKTSISSGASVRLDTDDEGSFRPRADGDTVVWSNEDGDVLTHFDLSTGVRSPFLPSS